ncbi:uncharacterized protein LOC144106728 isoform X2 [Amblyomma americanum]
MGETEKSSKASVEKAPAPDQARPSAASGFMVTAALCCVLIALLCVCVLVFWSSGSAASAKKQVMPDADGAGTKTDKTPPQGPHGDTHSSSARRTKPGPGKKTSKAPRRPGRHHALTCTLGPYMKADTVLPEDGLCSYIFLDWLPATKAADLAGPFPPNVTRFLSTAASYIRTEFGVAFDSKTHDKINETLSDPHAKLHLDALYDKRIWHFGYMNTDDHNLRIEQLHKLMLTLKKLKDLMKDKTTPDHQARIFLGCAYRTTVDMVPVRGLGASFSLTYTPDLLISKAHLSDADMCFDDCRILPSTFLQKPKFDNTNTSSLYDFSLLSAFQYASELKDQFKKSAVAVSVGLQGRWYLMPKNQTEDPVGGPCTTMALQDDNWMFDSAATACLNPAAQKSDDYNCKFVVNKTEGMVFTFDDVDTLRYKLCAGKKNQTSLKMGIVAAGIEFADAGGRCVGGKTTFPLLRALKSLVMFFKDHYVSERDFDNCLSRGTASQRRAKGRRLSR